MIIINNDNDDDDANNTNMNHNDNSNSSRTSNWEDPAETSNITPSPPTKSLDFEGFDSSRLLILRGGNSHVCRI